MKKITKIIIWLVIVPIVVVRLFVDSSVIVGIYQGITSNEAVEETTHTEVTKRKEVKEEKVELKEVELQAGFYTVGEDIEPGKYDIVHIDGQGLVDINDEYCFQIGTDRDYGDVKIVKNVELKEGDKIRVTSGLWFKFVPVE